MITASDHIRLLLKVPVDADWLARQPDHGRAIGQLAVLLEERTLDAIWHDGVAPMSATGEIFMPVARPPR